MTNVFLLLTPLLALGIIALLGFIGCDWVLGLHEYIEPATFNPPAGAYFKVDPVELHSPDGGEIFFWLLDLDDQTGGTGPGTPFQSNIPLSKSTKIKAQVVKDGKTADSFAKYYVGPILFQQGPAETSPTGTTAEPFPSPLGQGHLVLVWLYYRGTSSDFQVSMMTDSLMNDYVQAAGPTMSTPNVNPMVKQEIWYANNVQPGNAQISVTLQGSGTLVDFQIAAVEYSNNYLENDTASGPLADPLPPPGTAGTDSVNEPGNLVYSPTVSTNGRLAFAGAWFDGSGVFQAPWVSRSTIKSNVVVDLDVTVPGDVQGVFRNTSPTEGWIAQIITLR